MNPGRERNYLFFNLFFDKPYILRIDFIYNTLKHILHEIYLI